MFAASSDKDDLSPTAQRLVRRILFHWTEMAEGRGFPSLEDIDPWMVGDDWNNCLLVAIQTPLAQSRLLTVGRDLTFGAAPLPEGATLADCPADTLARLLLDRVPEVLSTKKCVVDGGEVRLRDRPILYRCVVLPLSADKQHIDHVLAAANYTSAVARRIRGSALQK
jgi:hypothetical protein